MTDGRQGIACGRYTVGIDLGTTNCAVSRVDLEGAESPEQFGILQLTGAGESASESLLPSFCYLPGEHELPAGALELPWGDDGGHAVGRFAREQGERVPERLVSSAKSWLAHAGVNRRNPILPWGSELGRQMISPVQASSFYLRHIRSAWDLAFAGISDRDGTPCTLATQSVVVTVPASFDETARKLTLEAAEDAGLSRITLLEEPLAAFYSWLSRHEQTWSELVPPGSAILVVDVGGGTTDFSLIELEEDGVLRRTAVGEHLLLGGDNMDMILARQAEQVWGNRLPQRQWSQLCQECRRIKELLLSNNAPEKATARVSGFGSSLFASLKSYDFHREAVRQSILDGFFPVLESDAAPPVRRRGMQEMGLPYASEPAVTRHLLQFLRRADGMAHPTHVLFNGGAMLPSMLRRRVLDCLERWGGTRPRELESYDLSLAVSEGAAYYGLARAGRAVRVKGGIARAYYLEVEGLEKNGEDALVCVMPRDTDEGVVRTLDSSVFTLRTNLPVVFPLFSSATRLGDRLGEYVPKSDDLTELPPLCTVLKYGRKGAAGPTALKAVLSSCLNETGVLELWCDVPETGHRFPLAFDLRGTAERQADRTTVEQGAIDAADTALRSAFSGGGLDGVVKAMERALGLERSEWSGTLLRHFADMLMSHPEWRAPSARYEERWLNLCGYCLRPGFGVAGDDWRVSEAWKLWFTGPLNPKALSCAVQWNVFWRRVAPGLKSGQQTQLLAELSKHLLNGTGANAIRAGDQAGIEMWRAAAVMERVGVNHKLKLLRALLTKNTRLDKTLFWPVARLGARLMFHGAQDTVIPPARWEPMLDALYRLADAAGSPRDALFAVANTTRLSGIRTADLSEAARRRAAEYLTRHDAPEAWCRMPLEVSTDTEISGEILGESLPLGLASAANTPR